GQGLLRRHRVGGCEIPGSRENLWEMGYRSGRHAPCGGSTFQPVRDLSRKCRRKILVPELLALGRHAEFEGAGDSRAAGHQMHGLQTRSRRATSSRAAGPSDYCETVGMAAKQTGPLAMQLLHTLRYHLDRTTQNLPTF